MELNKLYFFTGIDIGIDIDAHFEKYRYIGVNFLKETVVVVFYKNYLFLSTECLKRKRVVIRPF